MRIILTELWESNIPSLGLGYLASYAKKYGDFEDIKIIENEKEVLNLVKKGKVDIVGIKTVTPSYKKSLNLAKKIKAINKHIPIILGGPHVTSMPDRLDKTFDIGVIGEGEETFLELLKIYRRDRKFDIENLKKVNGIAYHNQSKVIITEKRMPIKDLDLIPMPAFNLYDKKYLTPSEVLCTHKKYVGMSIMTSRGCPYRCIYCQAVSQWGNFRMHSAKRVVDEIKYLHNHFGVNGIAIVDDLFIANKKRVDEIVDLLEKEGLLGKIEYLVSGRANLINEELLKKLKKMGVVQISLGFETGSDRLLRYLKKDSVTVEQNFNAAKLIKKSGIKVYGLFMLGSPTETKEEMLETLEFFKKLDIDTASITITCPLPGTELWDDLYKRNIVNYDMDWDDFMNPVYTPEKQLYINDIVSHEEFIKIYKEFQATMITRGLQDIQDMTLKDIILKSIKSPKIAIRTGWFMITKGKLKTLIKRKK